MSAPQALVRVDGLRKFFPLRSHNLWGRRVEEVRAVDDVSFEVLQGETLALVGESGSGKSTVGLLLLRLLSPTAGSIFYHDVELTSLRESAMRPLRRELQIILQDPHASLNPRMTVGHAVAEPLLAHRLASRGAAYARAKSLMKVVGLAPDHFNRYPHEFSGGQRQRVGVARALILNPSFIVADEPVSALDVSVQAQILNLLQRIQRTFGLTYLFITHDLGVVRQISDRVLVMYLGKLAELSPTDQFFQKPLHPYSQALLSAVPALNLDHKGERIVLSGDVPSALKKPQGCPFHPRCFAALERCKTEMPPWKDVGQGRSVACHLY